MPAEPRSAIRVHPVLERVFAPLHKRAFGVAVGLTTALVLFLLTAGTVMMQLFDTRLGLLSEYFYGYTVSWQGAVVGAWWGFVSGFAAGWFAAFLRNLAVATWIFVIRMKASVAQANEFLDHI